MQFGPTSRIPSSLTRVTSARSRAAPASPDSRNPAEMTTTAGMPRTPHSSTTSSTASLGTATTARSTSPRISRTERQAGMEWTTRADGFTGKMAPWNPWRRRLSTTCHPMVPGRRLAPMTAMPRGRKNGAMVVGMG